MHNLEYKARCPDASDLAERVRRAQAQGARHVQTLCQADTYFYAREGRLKLREWRDETGAHGAELIAYRRPDAGSSRLSEYQRVAIPQPDTLKALLETALGIRAIVEKERILYQFGATRIHFDTVRDLGHFIELETVFPGMQIGSDGEDQLEAEHRAVIAFMQLDTLDPVATSYGDLIERH
jgi:adenylate cyclase class 2